MFKQFSTAIKAYGKAINFIIDHNLWLYFLYPILIFVALFIGGTALIQHVSDHLQLLIVNYFGLGKTDSTVLGILSGALKFILSIGLRIIFFFLYSAILKYVVLIVLSPVLSMLSQKVDEIVTGKRYPFSFRQLIRDIFRGSFIAIRNMLFQFALIASCFLLMFIPIVGWIAPLFLIIINYYFYGFSMMDYTSERYKLNVSQSVLFIRKNKGLAIGNGFIFATIFAIPFIGVIIAPVVSVIAATIVAVEAQNKT